MEDEAFEQAFVVYGSDEVETRYLLSTAMLRRILDLKAAWGDGELRLAFHDSNLYLAIASEHDLFEPDLEQPIEPQLERLADELTATIGIVDDLALNTRIWSKTA